MYDVITKWPKRKVKMFVANPDNIAVKTRDLLLGREKTFQTKKKICN